MASIITATTTSGLTQSADNSGVLQLASGAGNLVTVPSVTGTAMVSGNMPAFSATNSGTQSITASTFTKILFQTEAFDTNNNFASSTFTPTVAGYYQITSSLNHDYSASSGSLIATAIYKNGSSYQITSNRLSSNQGPYGGVQAQALVYCNGSTDYVEIYAYSNNVGPSIAVSGTGGTTNFSGVLVRTA